MAHFKSDLRSASLKTDHGFALVVVIAAIGLLTLAVSIFAKVTRAQVRASAVAVETARANAFAEAGINVAVLKLLDFRSNQNGKQRNFAIGGQAFSCQLGNNILVTEALDEGGKIDLNFASERLLSALLIGLNVEPARAHTVVDTILDYRDGDNVKRPKGAEETEYRAAGRAQGPKNAPFAAVEELNQVLGIDAELFEEMTPFVTAHSGKEGIDPVVARRRLIEILRRGDTPLPPSDTGLDFQLDDRTSDLPVYFTGRSTRNIFTVRSDVVMAGGARFALEAIVDISPLRASGAAGSQPGRVYRPWRWRRVPSAEGAGVIGIAATALPECELPASI